MGIVVICIGFLLVGIIFMYIVYRIIVMYMFIVLDIIENYFRESLFFLE